MKKMILALIIMVIVPLSAVDLKEGPQLIIKAQGLGGYDSNDIPRKDSFVGIGYAHEVISPRDAASGLPTGKRQHKPVSITKKIDQVSPLLMNALVNNINLPSLTITYVVVDSLGAVTPFFEVQLTNASVARIEHKTDKIPLEGVTFYYQKISWTCIEGGISAEDDWETPVA